MKNGSKGGKASGEARRAKKTLREMVALINNLPASEKDKSKLKERGIRGKNAINQAVYLSAMLSHAIKGNGTAMRLWAELSEAVTPTGEEGEGITVNINIEDVSDHADQCNDPGTV